MNKYRAVGGSDVYLCKDVDAEVKRLTDKWIATEAELSELRTKHSNLWATVEAKQAKIDALMWEFCPGEMSVEQREEWARHQGRVEDDAMT